MSQGINILMYHQVGPFDRLEGAMAAHRSTYCRVDRFAAQMAFLKRFGYTVLSMDQVAACVRGEAPIPPRAVALTFDDGYENFAEHAWPILKQHGFPAMVYLIAGLVGRPSSWFERDNRPTPPLMTADRIRQLRAEGCDFGGHSVNHVKLAEQDDATIRREVTDCKAMLQDLLGEPVRHFCYPFGSHDLRAVAACAEAGWATATTCERSPATTADDPLTIPRKAIAWGDSLFGVWWKIHMKNTPKRPLIRRAAW
ncbi:MAG: polysaccharide deacetylase family protein [Proteobacteria bacterium]|nr:polysaccharide deacetylase family protein [Pseudomonadota bacterium]